MYDTGISVGKRFYHVSTATTSAGRGAFNDVRLYYSFEIELVAILRSLLQHCIQVRRGWRRTRWLLRFHPRMPAKMMTGPPVTLS